MSNSKVRIYELSKELNLDNKDILEICEQLNITVKSHSSTITESQAERIKASAEKYTPSHADKSHGSSPALSGRPAVAGPAKVERKQQILAIHHKQARSSDEQVSNQAVSSRLANPPRPPVKPQSPTLSPSISRPSVPATLPTQEQTKTDEEAVQAQPATPSRQSAKTAAKSASLPKLEAPSVLRPPSLESREVSQPMPRPVPKTESAIATQTPTLEIRSAKRGDKLPHEGAAKKTLAKSKAQLELHRPQLPKAAAVELIESEEELPIPDLELTEDEGLEEESLARSKQKPTLKRPTPPRAAKKAVWEQEEEDEAKLQAKVGKGTAKGKRRNQAVLDDEDEEELESEIGAALLPTSVSLSIARPPKPKSAAKQPVAVSASKPKKAQPKAETTRVKAERRDRSESEQRPESIALGSSLTIRELADLLKVPETDIIKNLFFKGIAVNITQTLDLETARLVAEELGVSVETAQEQAAAAKSTDMLDVADLENLHLRPPVVTIMGHVDHGKTTLLDSIRKTKVAQGEAGGITQHIGAYHVDVEHAGKSQQIVFLDTPGHEAFTAMRARGARVTDIAILVVAADDGVQPQTKEAISHARAAGVPIVVAINKIDKLDANPDRIKQELSELGLVPEEWGGDTIMVPVSALKGENLDNLLEMILLVAELEELSANPDRSAKGTVIEAHLDRARGPVATLLVQNGTLRVGDIVVAGSVFGKIRAMIDDRGDKVEAATPSFAVEILGLNDVPAAGDEFEVYSNEKEARAIAEHRAEEHRQSRLQQAMSSRRVTLSSLSAQAQEGELKELNLILKADVQGSVEAILGALQQLPQKEVQIRVLLSAPGEITETDVALAAASGAVIVGFNTTLATGARQIADQEGVDIREYDIIYKLLDDIQGAMEGLLEPEEIEEPLGQAEVRAVFPSGRGFVAGCYVLSGKVVRNRFVRVRRGGEVLYQGTLDSLKRFQEDAREVSAGYECGIGVPKFNDWKPGDIIEAYEMVMKRRTLSVR